MNLLYICDRNMNICCIFHVFYEEQWVFRGFGPFRQKKQDKFQLGQKDGGKRKCFIKLWPRYWRLSTVLAVSRFMWELLSFCIALQKESEHLLVDERLSESTENCPLTSAVGSSIIRCSVNWVTGFSEAVPAAVVPLLPAPAAGHKSHGVLVGAAPPHPRRQEQGPPGHLRHLAVRPPAPFTADLLRPCPLHPAGQLPLAHAAGRVLLPQPPQLGARHLLRRHPGEGLGGQRAAQEAPTEVFVLRVPQVGHLAPHTGFVPDLAGGVELVDVLLDAFSQLCRLVLVRRLGAEGGKEELDTFRSDRGEAAGRRWALCRGRRSLEAILSPVFTLHAVLPPVTRRLWISVGIPLLRNPGTLPLTSSISAVLPLPLRQQALRHPLHAVVGAGLQEPVEDSDDVRRLQLLRCDPQLIEVTEEGRDVPVAPVCCGSLYLHSTADHFFGIHGACRERREVLQVWNHTELSNL